MDIENLNKSKQTFTWVILLSVITNLILLLALVVQSNRLNTITTENTNKSNSASTQVNESSKPIFSITKKTASPSNFINFGKYTIMLSEGWNVSAVINSFKNTDDPILGDDCIVPSLSTPPTITSEPCKYVELNHPDFESGSIRLFDTRNQLQGGGGYIPTVTSTIWLGRGDNHFAFAMSWSGKPIDPTSDYLQNDTNIELQMSNGWPIPEYGMGCIADDLCIQVTFGQNADNLNTADIAQKQYEKFLELIQSLSIEE